MSEKNSVNSNGGVVPDLDPAAARRIMALVGELLITPGLEGSFREMGMANAAVLSGKRGPLASDAVKHARGELAASLELCFGELATRIVQRAVAPLHQELKSLEEATLVREAVVSLQEDLAALEMRMTERLEPLKLVASGMKLLTEGGPRTDEVAYCLPPGPAQYRFRSVAFDEKRRIAGYVTETYFDRPRRAFVLASTFAIHLAEALRRRRESRNSLFHSNSPCFTAAMMAKEQAWQVYTVSGSQSDNLCMGSYLSPSDHDGQKHVRDLFTRNADPLEFAILTPEFMTADGSLHFRRAFARDFVHLIAGAARHLVIVAPAERIYEDVTTLELEKPYESDSELSLADILGQRESEEVEIDYVVCGQFRKNVSPEALAQVADGCGGSFVRVAI